MRYIVKDYLECKRCTLCNSRKNIVFGNGSLPTDFLFIGDVPSEADDLRKEAFAGKQGVLLGYVIQFALKLSGKEKQPKTFFTHMLACRPKVITRKGELEIIKKDMLIACNVRLLRTIKDTKPKQVVLLGDAVRQTIGKLFPFALKLYHPNFLLRKGGLECPEFRQMARELSESFRKVEY